MSDVAIPLAPSSWADEHAQIRVPASAGLLARPLVATANHLLGWKLGTLRVLTSSNEGVPVAGTGYHRSIVQRHPNATHLLVVVRVEAYTSILTGGTITVTAGTGAATARTVEGTVPSTCIVEAPWGAADSGHCELEIKIEACQIRSLSVWDLHRRTLDPDAGDLAIDTLDYTYRQAGLVEGRYLVRSTNVDGVWGLAGRIVDARDEYYRQAVAWYDINDAGFTSVGAAFANPFDTDFVFRHQARTYRAADTHRHYTAYLYGESSVAGADTWEWQITTNMGGPWGSGALASGLGVGWHPAAGVTIDIDCTAIDDILLEVTTSDAAESVTVYGLSIVQEDHA
jgi:hypothetical protein